MQSNEFDKLMDGQDAKWLEDLNANKLDMKSLTPINEQIEKMVEEQQTTMPEEATDEIQNFITMLRGLKVKEAEIRRRVKIKFNIKVV